MVILSENPQVTHVSHSGRNYSINWFGCFFAACDISGSSVVVAPLGGQPCLIGIEGRGEVEAGNSCMVAAEET